MNSYFTRMLSLGLAFGLFFSACTQEPTIQEAKLNLDKENYKKALSAANKAIDENSSAPEPYYYKGLTHYRLARQKTDPSKRKRDYRTMREALSTALKLYKDTEDQSTEREDINPLLRSAWSEEHNSGTRIIDTDSSLTEGLMNNAIAHLENATVLIPDSTVSFQALGNAYYRSGDISKAINAFEQIVERDSSKITDVLEKLAFLYLEKGEADKATEYYQMADTTFENDLNIIHGLANAYISRDNHSKAIPLLRDLNERSPRNIEYHLALGTELYYLAREKADSVTTLYPEYKEDKDSTGLREMEQKIETIRESIREAEEHMTKAAKLEDETVEILNSVASFHQNCATVYKQLQDLRPTEDEKTQYQQLIESHLEDAIPYLQTLTETQEEDQKYWSQLYQIHSYLGNSDRADEALQKSNL